MQLLPHRTEACSFRRITKDPDEFVVPLNFVVALSANQGVVVTKAVHDFFLTTSAQSEVLGGEQRDTQVSFDHHLEYPRARDPLVVARNGCRLEEVRSVGHANPS